MGDFEVPSEIDTQKQEQEARLIISDNNMFCSLRLSPNSYLILNKIGYHFTFSQLKEEKKKLL